MPCGRGEVCEAGSSDPEDCDDGTTSKILLSDAQNHLTVDCKNVMHLLEIVIRSNIVTQGMIATGITPQIHARQATLYCKLYIGWKVYMHKIAQVLYLWISILD
eukprot:UN02055